MSELSPARRAELIRSLAVDIAELEYAETRAAARLADIRRELTEQRAALEKLRKQND